MRLTEYRKGLATLVCAVLLVLGVGGYFWWGSPAVVRALTQFPPARADMQTYIFTLVRARGVPFALDVVAAASQEGRISDDDCHLLLHVIGHESYARDGTDFATELAPIAGRSKLCSGGYLHGIEGQIAEEGLGSKDILWKFCAIVKEQGLGFGPCFHGAGHEIFTNLKDIHQALAFCDALMGGPESNPAGCYRGAFSEMGLEMGGWDTHTGESLPPLVVPGISEKHPLLFCDALKPRYQYPCYTQLSALYFNGNTTMDLGPCLAASATDMGRAACVEIVVGLTARQLLPDHSATLAGYLERVPSRYRTAALKGIWDAHSREQRNGRPPVVWESICARMTSTEVRASCESFTAETAAALEAAHS